jgi:hypothetical protein
MVVADFKALFFFFFSIFFVLGGSLVDGDAAPLSFCLMAALPPRWMLWMGFVATALTGAGEEENQPPNENLRVLAASGDATADSEVLMDVHVRMRMMAAVDAAVDRRAAVHWRGIVI